MVHGPRSLPQSSPLTGNLVRVPYPPQPLQLRPSGLVVCLPRWFLRSLQNSQSRPSFTQHLFFTHCVIKRQRFIPQLWRYSHRHAQKLVTLAILLSLFQFRASPDHLSVPRLIRTVRAPASYSLFTFTTTANQ